MPLGCVTALCGVHSCTKLVSIRFIVVIKCVSDAEDKDTWTAIAVAHAPHKTLQEKVEAVVGKPIRDWPDHYKRAAIAKKIGFTSEKYASGTGRHSFACFVLHNGCKPSLYVEWVQERGCIKADAYPEIKNLLTKLAIGQNVGSTWDVNRWCKMKVSLDEESIKDVPKAIDLISSVATTTSLQRAQPEGCKEYYHNIFPYESV